jgi:integral membrane protein
MSALRFLRVVGLLEGLSFVVLLFVAVPLKHVFGLPLAVRVVGSVHGLLFILFASTLYRVATEQEWPVRRSLMAFVASLLPFGPFVLDRSLKRELDALRD